MRGTEEKRAEPRGTLEQGQRAIPLPALFLPALFFRIYVDRPAAKSDAEILCRLEYQSDKGFYLLKRVVQ
jgi:hypothetical protein